MRRIEKIACLVLYATFVSAFPALAGAGGGCGAGTVSLPEPISMALLAVGIGGIVALRRLNRK